jgi:hypothetical protein
MLYAARTSRSRDPICAILKVESLDGVSHTTVRGDPGPVAISLSHARCSDIGSAMVYGERPQLLSLESSSDYPHHSATGPTMHGCVAQLL